MEVIAKSKNIRLTPRKMRQVAVAISGLNAAKALEILANLNKGAAKPLLLILRQGVGNAVNNFHLEEKSLLIKRIEVGKGPTLKRGRPVSRGRWHPVLKRTSHVKLVLEGETVSGKKKKQAKEVRGTKQVKQAKKAKKGAKNGEKN